MATTKPERKRVNSAPFLIGELLLSEDQKVGLRMALLSFMRSQLTDENMKGKPLFWANHAADVFEEACKGVPGADRWFGGTVAAVRERRT
jgi:hypothetical protein